MTEEAAGRRVCKVLVVEDDRYIQELLGDVFAHEGYRFLCVGTVEAFRRALDEEEALDVAVIDVVIPGGANGLALAREAAARGLGVILATGHHDHFASVQGSGYSYVLKPFRIAALLEAVEEALAAAKRRCMREAQRGA
jgi:two-component system phosphate regulon response regulator OmpR